MTTLVADARRAQDVGRCARLELRFGVRNGATVMKHQYAEPPFRISRPFRAGSGLHLILASSSPGIFSGDTFQQDIVIEPGAHVRLTSQSALQVHPGSEASTSGACVRGRYSVGDGARLECEWHPAIPFARSRLKQRIELDVAAGGRLCWSDAFMTGRDASGERWQCESLDHELRCLRGGHLDYLERYRLEPSVQTLTDRWIASDAAYYGTILVSDCVDRQRAEEIHHALAIPGVRAATDLLADGLMLIRLMARDGARFHSARALVQSLIVSLREEADRYGLSPDP